MTSSFARRARAGYTLIELIMVILILGIMLSLVFAKVEHLTPRYSLRAAARDLARVVALARSQAAAQGRIYFVRYKLVENRYYLLAPFEDEAPAPTRENPGAEPPPIPQLHWEPVFKQQLPEGILFRDVVVGTSDKVEEQDVNVEISPFGITKGHVVHLTDGRNDYSIEINPLTGHARFHEEYFESPSAEEDETK